MIEVQALEDMFSNIKSTTMWDLNGPMLWGYFFTDSSEEKLQSFVPTLQKQGYRFVDLYVPELDEGMDEYFFLHVEKEEIHSVSSLHQRNQELESLAYLHQIGSYDGMDVGPILES